MAVKGVVNAVFFLELDISNIAVSMWSWSMTGLYKGDGSDGRCHCSSDSGADVSKYRRLHVSLIDDWDLQRR